MTNTSQETLTIESVLAIQEQTARGLFPAHVADLCQIALDARFSPEERRVARGELCILWDTTLRCQRTVHEANVHLDGNELHKAFFAGDCRCALCLGHEGRCRATLTVPL